MGITQNKTSLILALIFTISFSFGVDTMSMDANGNMSDCPFTDVVALCPMSFSEHIAVFQSIFRAIPSRTSLLTLLVLAFFLILSPRTITPDQPSRIKSKFLFKDRRELPIFNKLLIALSDGILQPKLYA